MGTAERPCVRHDLGSPIGTCTCPEHADAEARELIISMLRAGRHTEPEALAAALADCVVAPIIQRAEWAEQQLIDCGADRDEERRRARRAASMYAQAVRDLADRNATIRRLEVELERTQNRAFAAEDAIDKRDATIEAAKAQITDQMGEIRDRDGTIAELRAEIRSSPTACPETRCPGGSRDRP